MTAVIAPLVGIAAQLMENLPGYHLVRKRLGNLLGCGKITSLLDNVVITTYNSGNKARF